MTTYLIRKSKNGRNGNFEEFVPEEGNYLFTIKTPYEDIIHDQFSSDVNNLRTKGNKGDRSIEMVGIAGVFSSLMTYTSCFLYNNEEMLQAYPNGLVTNDKIFLPTPLVKKLSENRKDSPIPGLLINGLLSIIEKKYNVDLSQDVSTLLNGMNREIRRYVVMDNDLEKIPYVHAPSLESILSKTKINPDSIKRITDVSSTNYIDNVLHHADEMNNPSHPFSQLKSQVKNHVKSILPIVKNIDTALDDYWNNMNADNIESLLASLQHQLSDIVNSSPDFNNTVKQVETTWFNKAVKVGDHHISDVLAMYMETMQAAYPNLNGNTTTNFIENTIFSIVKEPDVYDEVRDILIKSATGFNLNTQFENKKYTIVDKEKYELEKQYLEACKSGDLEKIRVLLTNAETSKKIDILNDDMKGFTIACKKKHSEIANYLLSSPELDNHIPINTSSLSIISENKLCDVFEDLMTKPQLQEALKQEGMDYATMINAGRLGSIQAVKNLLSFDIHDKKLKATNALAGASKNGHLPLVKMLLTEVFSDEYETFKKTDQQMTSNYLSTHKNDYKKNEELAKEKSVYHNIQSSFFNAVESQKEEVAQYYIYDYDLQLTDDYAKKADELPEIKKMLGLRELNKQLQKDLPIINNTVKTRNKL